MHLKTRVRQAVGGALFATGLRRRIVPGSLTVLLYHAVTASPYDDDGQMSVSIERFEEHLAAIADAGVDVVDLSHGVDRLRRGELARAAVAITFDDGFVGVHDHAAPALARRGWAATVFVATGWVGASAMPLAEPRLGRPMTWSELETIAGSGISIGSHTHTHPYLTRLDETDVRMEIRDARDRLADRLGRRPNTFAYPFGAPGSFDARTKRVLVEEGFGVGCTSIFGRNGRGADPLALRRSRASWVDTADGMTRILAGAYDWYAAVQRTQRSR